MSGIKDKLLLLKIFLKKNSPGQVMNLYRSLAGAGVLRKYKSRKKRKKIQAEQPVSYGELKSDLLALGLKQGMKVMVHSSLSGLGFVEGGPATVVQCIIDIVGTDGLILMPSPPATGSQADFLRRSDVFDVTATKCTTGAICETFRNLPGVFRSAHPTHSVTALGKDAEWITKDHHLDSTPFGKHSPFARIFEIGGSVLGIGLDTRWITFYHYFEDITPDFPINVYADEIHTIPVISKNGDRLLVNTPHHNPLVSSVRLNNDMQTLNIINEALNKYSNIQRGKTGRGEGYLVSTYGILNTLSTILAQNGQTIYNRELVKKIAPETLKPVK